jgi:hypothetical protein
VNGIPTEKLGSSTMICLKDVEGWVMYNGIRQVGQEYGTIESALKCCENGEKTSVGESGGSFFLRIIRLLVST